MKNKFFDKQEFNEAASIIETNPIKAKIKFDKYLAKYPNDYSAYIYYANLLMTFGDFERANIFIEKAESVYSSDEVFTNNSKKAKIYKFYIFFNKIKLLCLTEKYDEAYKFYLDNINGLDNVVLEKVVFFCKNKLGLLEKTTTERNSYHYYYRQVIEYQESDFLYHAKKHCNNCISNNSEDESEFTADFPIEEVISEVKKNFFPEKRLYHGFTDNVYVFRYDGCGTYNNGVINYFKVITFNNTKDLITMYPSVNCENLPYVDLNYMRKAKDNVKVKRLSQIDKFNKRFNINKNC